MITNIGTVYCIGRNYHEHIKEMSAGHEVSVPQEPVIFLKPATAIVSSPARVTIPEFNGKKISDNLHHEIELVVIIGKDGNNIPEDKAMDYIYGYAAGIDLTLRDLQARAKAAGMPWTLSKGFRGSAPVSDIVARDNVKDVNNLDMLLKVNNIIRQKANTSQMIFSVGYIIHYISSVFGLRKNDVIFTGTPEGVASLKSGDFLSGEISSVGRVEVVVE